MAIAVKSFSTYGPIGNVNPSLTANQASITPPSDIAVGDYVLVSVIYQVLAGNGADVTPSGFTKLNGGGTTAGRLMASYGLYVSDQSLIPGLLSGISLNATGTSSTRVAAGVLVLSGVDPTTPVLSFGGVVESSTSKSTLSVPSATGDFTVTSVYSNNGAGTGAPTFTSSGQSAYLKAVGYSVADTAAAATTVLSMLPGGTTLNSSPAFANAGAYTLGFKAKVEIPEETPAEDEVMADAYVLTETQKLPVFLEGVVNNRAFAEVDQPKYSTAGKVYEISDLLSTEPFYSAHRGSGGNWPEHTMLSYSKSVNHGMKAIEVSVVASKDGILFCQHDKSMKRTTGVDALASEMLWADIQKLTVTAEETDNPLQPRQPLVALKDVLDAYAETHVIFIEDKQGTNARPLLDMMDTYADATKHFIWKQWAGAGQYTAADRRGYTTWGYFQTQDFTNFDLWAPRFDIIGVHTGCTDEQILRASTYCKANNLKLICWEIHTPAQRQRALSLGVDGLMTANILNVMRTPM